LSTKFLAGASSTGCETLAAKSSRFDSCAHGGTCSELP
jgi:hypothetical protein